MKTALANKVNWWLAASTLAVAWLIAQPAAAALADWPGSGAASWPSFALSVGNSVGTESAVDQMLADVIEQAKAELAAATNSMGLGVVIELPTDQLPAQPGPQRDGRLPDVLLPGSGNSTSCGGTSVSGSSTSGSAQVAAAFFSAVTLADYSPRGRLPREASLQFSSNSLRPPTPPPRG